MEIRGIRFVGSHTHAHEEMSAFVRDVLGLAPITVERRRRDAVRGRQRRRPRGGAPLRGGRHRTAHDRAARRRRRRCRRRAARRRDRDRRDLRERPLALHALPRAGREAVRARGGALPGQALVEAEMQLGERAGLRPVVHERPRHEPEAGLLQHASRAPRCARRRSRAGAAAAPPRGRDGAPRSRCPAPSAPSRASSRPCARRHPSSSPRSPPRPRPRRSSAGRCRRRSGSAPSAPRTPPRHAPATAAIR